MPASHSAFKPTHTIAAPTDLCDVGLIGLAVMGQNLVLNLADHGYRVACYNRSYDVTKSFVALHPPKTFGDGGGLLRGAETLSQFVQSLKAPRNIILLIKAGSAIDEVCRQLISAGVQPDDIVVDGGNSLWTDTIRREREYRGTLTFFGSGVSGGETGARFGPSLMPGGDERAWKRLKPIWESIAAKVDAATGKPLEGAAPGRPVKGGVPCTAYIGPNGAGHYVKMVHNGIEYADMQLICEAYDLLRQLAGMSPRDVGKVFSQWNEGDLDSFLIEITADILQQQDPITGQPFVDIVLDSAGQKGTGKWTAVNALDMGVPAQSIAEAVFARAMSASKDERIAASNKLSGPDMRSKTAAASSPRELTNAVRDALYCSKVCAYAQGFQLMRAAQQEYDWTFNFADLARIWRGGCIIRARFLQKITEAFEREPNLPNLLLDPYFRDRIGSGQQSWRTAVAAAVHAGISCPAFSSSLAYYDGYRTATLPHNLLQAQRDYFGAHTYERVDQPRGRRFHLDWPDPKRPQTEVG